MVASRVWCGFAWLAVVFLAENGWADAPLHQRIDAAIDAARLGAEVPVCSDAEFLRRVYLDLAGTIPTAAETRAFLDDAAANKREAVVDRLLADPRFARRMQVAFDVMLMERRPAKNVTAPEWTAFLHSSFQQNRPLNEIARDVLAADGVEDARRGAARFYLDREGEKNLVTRDVGRVFLGRDMQCAQCHDHPLVDDYLQGDYFGVFAFYSRSLLFTDAKAKKSYFAENAEGDQVDFTSVFTKEARKSGPHLPGRPAIDEPKFEKGQEYVVAPAKDVRPVPKFSRRAEFAKRLTDGSYRGFQRNLANRLWGLMLGRGIVHPYDLDHSGNPPANAALLELLTDELAAMKFDTRRFLREVALSKAYQRSATLPEKPEFDRAAIEQRIADAKMRIEQQTREADATKEELAKLETEWQTFAAPIAAAHTELAKVESATRDAEKKVADAEAAVKTAREASQKKADAHKTLGELLAAAKQTQAKLADEKVVADTVAQLTARTEQLAGEATAAEKMVAEKTAQVTMLAALVAPAREAQTKAAAAHQAALAARQPAEARRSEVERRLTLARAEIDSSKQLLTDGETWLAWQAAFAQKPDDAATASAWKTWSERWTRRFFAAELEPLTPEQLTASMMQATNQVEPARVAAESAEKAKREKEGQPVEPVALSQAGEAGAWARMAGEMNAFVNVLSPGSGPGITEYQSTVQEALFLANGPKVSAWIKPVAANLAKQTDVAALAEEAYLSVLSRRPTADETTAVTNHLAGRDADRPLAVEEVMWGLLTAAEFRFSH